MKSFPEGEQIPVDVPMTMPNGDDKVTLQFGPLTPKASEWSWSFGPDFSIRFTPVEGDVPNAFHRWMQEVCLGIKWRKRAGNTWKT